MIFETKNGGIEWKRDSALYQLMNIRMNGVINDIVSSDEEYQAILWRSDEYANKLDRIELPKNQAIEWWLRQLAERSRFLVWNARLLTQLFWLQKIAFGRMPFYKTAADILKKEKTSAKPRKMGLK